MEMRYYWLLDSETQKQFKFGYHSGEENLVGHFSKTHKAAGQMLNHFMCTSAPLDGYIHVHCFQVLSKGVLRIYLLTKYLDSHNLFSVNKNGCITNYYHQQLHQKGNITSNTT